jgi:hypothetical protein
VRSHLGVPDFAGAVVGAGDELVAALVEGAVRERQNVRPQNLEQVKVVVLRWDWAAGQGHARATEYIGTMTSILRGEGCSKSAVSDTAQAKIVLKGLAL